LGSGQKATFLCDRNEIAQMPEFHSPLNMLPRHTSQHTWYLFLAEAGITFAAVTRRRSGVAKARGLQSLSSKTLPAKLSNAWLNNQLIAV
jgi:hypothetical protein